MAQMIECLLSKGKALGDISGGVEGEGRRLR
jgi:hypothetical protein